ncbi:MAG: molecular chaperone HtpG [Bdellovibrionales bacterium]
MAEIKQEFQAEVKELLNLMVHSIYSNKEIFLRELVSNATDAIDKRKFEALTKPEFAVGDEEYSIQLIPNKETKSLQIIDNGIGMSQEELVENIGTIARSGTKQFMSLTKEMKNNPELIGQFGVGFYASFMVADRVTLHTKRTDSEKAYFWESTGDGTYKIQELDKTKPGTTVTLYFKEFAAEEEVQDFTEEWVLRSLVKKYSDFIPYPVQMDVTRQEPVMDEEGKAIEGQTTEVTKKETFNSMKALWTRSPSQVTEEEYKEFYKQTTMDWNDPLKHVHYKAEGTMEFCSILYIPGQKPFNFNTVDAKWGLDLYVKKVFIMSQCEDLIPNYLRFVRGVVDSSDLSLNISREMLQQDRQIKQIKKAITAKILNTLKDLLIKEPEEYNKFYANFGTVLKEGAATENSNMDKIAELLLFKTTNSEVPISLQQYLDNKPDNQDKIYFITGGNYDQLKNSPHIEVLKEKNFEVILMDDDIDEWVVNRLKEYKGVSLVSATKEDLGLESDEEKTKRKEETEKLNDEYKDVISGLSKALDSRVKEVRISNRLKDSPVVLVDEETDMSANMKRILEQHRGESFDAPRLMEINPNHPIFNKLKGLDESQLEDWAELFYGQALLNEGSALPDPHLFSQKLNKLLS